MKLMQSTILALVAMAPLNVHAGHHESEKHAKPNLKNAVDQLMDAFEKRVSQCSMTPWQRIPIW